MSLPWQVMGDFSVSIVRNGCGTGGDSPQQSTVDIIALRRALLICARTLRRRARHRQIFSRARRQTPPV